MNIFSTRTRRGAAILFSGVLVLGGLALTSEASAVKNVDDNPTCEGLGFTYGQKWDDEPSAGVYTVNRDGMVASLTVGTYPDKPEPNEDNAITAYSVKTAGEYAIVVKGSDGATVYGPGAKVPLHAPANASGKWPTISHFDLCWNKPAPEPYPGELVVTKVVVGTDTPEDHEFEICVSRVPDGDALCKDVEGNGTVTFENLRPGDYVVTETDPAPEFSVKGSGVTVTVKSETTATATITNTWIPPDDAFGRVEVTKAVTGEGAPTVDETYRICLTGPEPATTQVCKTVEGEGTLAFEGLVPGRYAVTEPDADGKDYTATFTPTNGIVDVTIDATAKATVTNTYTDEESLPPPPEVRPPTVPVTPTAPTAPTVAPATEVASATATQVTAQTALPTTGSEGGIAAIAALLVATGLGLMFVGRRREPQQA